MEFATVIYIFSVFCAFLMLAYYYWKDASAEGFSNTKIFDSYFLLVLFGLLGGKFLFRTIDYEYIRYSLISAPLILEGVFVGVALTLYLYTRKNHLDGWKLGDSIASGLVLFKAILFLGFYISTRYPLYAVISSSFAVLFAILRHLKNKKMYGTSRMFFEMKRYNKVVITGALVTVYLTVSSVIAMLFLVINPNLNSGFWFFQVIFYIFVSIASLVLFRSKMHKQLEYDNKQQHSRKN